MRWFGFGGLTDSTAVGCCGLILAILFVQCPFETACELPFLFVNLISVWNYWWIIYFLVYSYLHWFDILNQIRRLTHRTRRCETGGKFRPVV